MKTFASLLFFCSLVVVFHTGAQSFALGKSKVSQAESSANTTVHHSFVVLGASGDLAKREIYPSLWSLFSKNLLPPNTRFYGYARQNITVDDIRKNVAPFVEVSSEQENLYNKFWDHNSYIPSLGNDDADYDRINELIEESLAKGEGTRIFYMALPPSVFPRAASQIKRACMAKNGDTRIVIEKPFGHDSASSQELSEYLSKLFTEDQIYRMDHYLGKEMVRNIQHLRFDNRILSPSWNKENIAAVEVLFEENLGVEGRGSYFDRYGIIRDVMQNHLLQVVSLIAMDKPESGHPDDIRDAKVNVLKDTESITLNDVVLGQYVANPKSNKTHEQIGYRKDSTVPDDSLTSTFAVVVLKINNEQWKGVPFIIRAGKGLKEKRTKVTIQYRDVEDKIQNEKLMARNELVLQISNEAIEMKMMSKTPGVSSNIEPIHVDFTYKNEYEHLNIPDAYEKLLLDIFRGSQVNFVRTDELSEAWRIFTPVLDEIERKKIRPIEYKFGTYGPVEADELERKNNFL